MDDAVGMQTRHPSDPTKHLGSEQLDHLLVEPVMLLQTTRDGTARDVFQESAGAE